MKYQVRPRVSTELDSRLWQQELEALLNCEVVMDFTVERAEVPIADLEVPDDIPVKDVVAAGQSLKLTILEV